MLQSKKEMIEAEFQDFLSKSPILKSTIDEEVIRRIFFAGIDAHNICCIRTIKELEKQYGTSSKN